MLFILQLMHTADSVNRLNKLTVPIMVSEFNLLGSTEGSMYNGIGYVEIYKILAMQDAFLFGTISFDRV